MVLGRYLVQVFWLVGEVCQHHSQLLRLADSRWNVSVEGWKVILVNGKLQR